MSILVIWKRIFVFLRFSLLSYVNGVFGTKNSFLKTGLRVEVFENAGWSLSCGWTKTEVFEYDDLKHHAEHVRDARVFALCAWAKTIRLH